MKGIVSSLLPLVIITVGTFVGLSISLARLCFRFTSDKRKILINGKIEIKFTEIDKEEGKITIKHKDLILEIRYRLMDGSKYNKEKTAILINDLVRRQCKLRRFRIRNNTKKTFKEIKDIIEEIKPLLPRETNSEITSVNYRISEKTITNWPKEVFAQV